jgi:hypothetical protein
VPRGGAAHRRGGPRPAHRRGPRGRGHDHRAVRRGHPHRQPGPDAPPDLTGLLFGDLLGVTTSDLVAAGALAVATAVALAALHRPLTAVAHDRQAARALSIRPARTEAALLVLLGVALVVAVQGLGNLLVVALLIAPGVAATRLTTACPASWPRRRRSAR